MCSPDCWNNVGLFSQSNLNFCLSKEQRESVCVCVDKLRGLEFSSSLIRLFRAVDTSLV